MWCLIKKKIDKREAKKLYDEGEMVYLVPAKANIDSYWIRPLGINKEKNGEFDKVLSKFEYFNCVSPFSDYAWFFTD